MDLSSEIFKYGNESQEENEFSVEDLKTLISLLDLTTLNQDEPEEFIKLLCQKASSPLGTVAAICVYPKFVSLVAKELPDNNIKIVSVANFPTGNEDLVKTIEDIQYAIRSGASEMDIVFPYHLYLKGNIEESFQFIKECRIACKNVLLKVILETSEFDSLEKIYALSNEIISAGADFIKTSTGRSKQGATVENAGAMLLAIKSSQQKNMGFKASGGIKEIGQALSYVHLAKNIMGDDWVNPKHFRIGASILLDKILAATANNS